jgi:hypothetical protein
MTPEQGDTKTSGTPLYRVGKERNAEFCAELRSYATRDLADLSSIWGLCSAHYSYSSPLRQRKAQLILFLRASWLSFTAPVYE